MKYTPTIGLEIHAELKTQTKMFCDSKNDPNETRPNINICPVCMAHPGVLPVINREAVRHVLRVGCALGGTLADYTEFDRKNYFYPDLPKGYQISQYKYPLISHGSLNGVVLTRIHLEEDTARSVHDGGSETLIDFNRAGIPLMELVTEPVVRDAQEAGNFARELQLLLRYLNASDANMEKGEMRVEANVSISSSDAKGTKVEVKNLNSFKSVERAIEYEISRQISVLERGETVLQETRGWDENKEVTFSQRVKEESHDYRYMPDPDLPKLRLSEIEDFSQKHLKESLPELPWDKRDRYITTYSMESRTAELFVQNERYYVFFDKYIAPLYDKEKEKYSSALNYFVSDIIGLLQKGGDIKNLDTNFNKTITLLTEGHISSRGAKDILKILVTEGGDPQDIAKNKGLLQENNEEALTQLVEEIIKEHPDAVSEYTSGKDSALQFLVGQGMQKSRGSANPQILSKLLKEKLS